MCAPTCPCPWRATPGQAPAIPVGRSAARGVAEAATLPGAGAANPRERQEVANEAAYAAAGAADDGGASGPPATAAIPATSAEDATTRFSVLSVGVHKFQECFAKVQRRKITGHPTFADKVSSAVAIYCSRNVHAALRQDRADDIEDGRTRKRFEKVVHAPFVEVWKILRLTDRFSGAAAAAAAAAPMPVPADGVTKEAEIAPADKREAAFYKPLTKDTKAAKRDSCDERNDAAARSKLEADRNVDLEATVRLSRAVDVMAAANDTRIAFTFFMSDAMRDSEATARWIALQTQKFMDAAERDAATAARGSSAPSSMHTQPPCGARGVGGPAGAAASTVSTPASAPLPSRRCLPAGVPSAEVPPASSIAATPSSSAPSLDTGRTMVLEDEEPAVFTARPAVFEAVVAGPPVPVIMETSLWAPVASSAAPPRETEAPPRDVVAPAQEGVTPTDGGVEEPVSLAPAGSGNRVRCNRHRCLPPCGWWAETRNVHQRYHPSTEAFPVIRRPDSDLPAQRGFLFTPAAAASSSAAADVGGVGGDDPDEITPVARPAAVASAGAGAAAAPSAAKPEAQPARSSRGKKAQQT